ncbi:peptide-binding protein [Niabella ginsenosidivorans]|uniref:Peptide-binding protein n=1 Tax=Niabella ginsenosidivorans TaxID=1176587 RepID=A0A1A9HW61_9BACT|nr:PDZ domain-containing protein [Niabella ginsenosidivorans]ANH79626.1 peptide-binding protein [Niabella ginsenosidivorans]
MLRLLLLLLIVFTGTVTGDAQTAFYIDANGSDSNPGTLSKPLLTLERALQKAQVLKGKDATIYLRKGTYYFSQTVQLAGIKLLFRSLTIRNYNNEKVVFSAGRKLSLQWKPYKNGIYVAKVPAGTVFERLYINGQLQVLARYPDYDSTAKVFNGTAADAIAPERVKKWKNPEGGYVHALHAAEWGSFHYKIISANAKGNLKLEGGWQNNRPSPLHKRERFVENIFEELDAPGEWFLDEKAQLLYYFPRPGINLSKALAEVPVLRQTIRLLGSSTNPVRNVEISGIEFAHNERSFMETKEPLLRSDWTIYRGAAVYLEGTEDCRISNCTFNGIGGNAIMMSGYNKRDTVQNCLVQYAGASGICFVGNADAVRSPSFSYGKYVPYAAMDKTPGPKSAAYPQYCVADNNLVHDIGQIEKQATGVEIEIASHITVSHNSIYNTPRAGINIGDGCFGGHLLEYNDVFNTVLETGDHGAFNSWGRDRYWATDRKYMDSLVALHSELILLDAQQTTIIRNNRFRCDHGWDIDLDDGSSNYRIYNNLCLNGGLKLREGFYRMVENNIMINNSFHPHVWFQNSGDIFRHNIIMKAYAPIAVKYWGKQIDSNFFMTEKSLDAARADQTDAHSSTGPLVFKDAAKGDFSLLPGAAAFSIGFENFPMDQFGVQTSRLKQLAKRAPIPPLLDAAASDKEPITDLLKGKVKSVDGLGDRSTYGLPDETGVIIITPGTGILATAGLREGDVIRSANGKPIRNVKDLKTMINGGEKQIKLEVIRNQQSQTLLMVL